MNSNRIELEAADWLARLDQDSSSATDLSAFEQWHASDPRNAAAYARLAATWQALDRIQAVRPRLDQPIDSDYLNEARRHTPVGLPQDSAQHTTERSLQDRVLVEHWIFAKSLRLSSKEPAYRPRFLLSAGVSLLAVVAVSWITLVVGGSRTITTGVGGFQRVVLEDRSVIELNTNSEVRVKWTSQRREVELVRGEASFEVAHDRSRPFMVCVGKTAVRAVGTKFDVRRLVNSVEVTVDEGEVAVGELSLLDGKTDPLALHIPRLSAGKTAIASSSGVSIKELPIGIITRKLAWQSQVLVFDGDTLADVVAQFNRYNERQLVIADANLATIQIGGYFRPTNLDAFVSVLQSNFGIRADSDGTHLVLSAAVYK